MGGLGIRGSSDIYHYEKGVHYLQLADRPSESLCLTRCGYHDCPPDHSWGPKARPQYHMHFIIDGKGTLEINGKTYHLGKGQIFLLPPNVTSCYYADHNDPWHYAFACFVGTQAERYLKKAGFSDEVIIRHCNLPIETFTSCIDEMLDAHQLTITNELKRSAALCKLFALLTESNTPQNSEQQYDYSSQNLNTSPKDYLLHYRMEHAKYLLETTDEPIKGIASSVGYNDPLTFSKMFSNLVGISPSEYRKNRN